jgi:hypothetical protein
MFYRATSGDERQAKGTEAYAARRDHSFVGAHVEGGDVTDGKSITTEQKKTNA